MIQQRTRPRSLDYLTGNDVFELLPDLLTMQSGRSLRADKAHPLALAAHKERMPLLGLRDAAGMTASDFGTALEVGLSQLLKSSFTPSNTDVQRVTKTIEVRDFKDVGFPTISMEEPGEEAEDAHETAPLKMSITEGDRKGRLRTFSGKIRFARHVWLTWGTELAAAITDYSQSIFPGIERRLLAECLEGATWTTGTGSLSIAGMETAATALRDQTNGAGQKCGLGIAALIVPSKLEMTARVVREGLGWRDLGITVLPDLTSDTTWYAVADPQLSAPVTRLVLQSSPNPRIYLNPRIIEGFEAAVQHDVDFVPLSGVPGIVKVSP